MASKMYTILALAIVLIFPVASLLSWQSSGLFSEVEVAASVAVGYVKNSPTFRFDGIVGSVEVTETVALDSYPMRFGVLVEFDSRQAGYGDRSGMMLAQVVTHHVVRVWVTRWEVSRAIMDDVWDMMNQTMIS